MPLRKLSLCFLDCLARDYFSRRFALTATAAPAAANRPATATPTPASPVLTPEGLVVDGTTGLIFVGFVLDSVVLVGPSVAVVDVVVSVGLLEELVVVVEEVVVEDVVSDDVEDDVVEEEVEVVSLVDVVVEVVVEDVVVEEVVPCSLTTIQPFTAWCGSSVEPTSRHLSTTRFMSYLSPTCAFSGTVNHTVT